MPRLTPAAALFALTLAAGLGARIYERPDADPASPPPLIASQSGPVSFTGQLDRSSVLAGGPLGVANALGDGMNLLGCSLLGLETELGGLEAFLGGHHRRVGATQLPQRRTLRATKFSNVFFATLSPSERM